MFYKLDFNLASLFIIAERIDPTVLIVYANTPASIKLNIIDQIFSEVFCVLIWLTVIIVITE